MSTKSGTIEFINGNAVIVEKRDEKTLLVFEIQLSAETCAKLFSPGESVRYTVLWTNGWEGEGADVIDRTGKSHRAHMAIYYVGKARSISGIADDLNVDEDQLGFQNL